VKAFTRAFCVALVTVAMLGVTGCGPDNETEGQNLNKNIGDPGKVEGKAVEGQAPPRTNADRAGRGPQGTVNQFGKKDAAPTPKK
jgi:hypothetical protein